MSLYTPVFPSFDEPNSSPTGLPDNTSAAAPAKQQNYAKFLRDVHLSLSTQSDMLSPPSRPNSPLSDHRVQKRRDEIQDAFIATEGQTSSGKWARVSQSLKLGCLRGRPWSVSKADPCAPEEDTNWILPDEESEWMEWEKKREESRRLKGKTNASQQVGIAASLVPDSQKPSRASFAELSQPNAKGHERLPRDVSPATLHAAKEKVRVWQASVASGLWHNTTSASSPAATRAVVAATAAEGKTERQQRSRTLDFAVVKSAAKLTNGKKGKVPLSRTAVRSGPSTTPSHKSKSPKPSNSSSIPAVRASVDIDKTGSKRPLKTLPVKEDRHKIADVPETPYLPPSFPAHLETSTPLASSVMLVRAKPSPIFPLPTSSSTPPLSTLANPPEDRQGIPAEPHPASMSSSLPPQIHTAHPGKRSRGFSTSFDSIPDDPLLTPPAKRLRTLSQNPNPVSKRSKSMLPNGGLDIVPDTRADARDPSLGAAPPHRYNMGSLEIVSPAPLTPGKNDQLVTGADAEAFREKIPSPTKSVKSYFSAPDSDPGDSPMKANLLLDSPVSPMLSYAQNPSGFLPQITSTQLGKGSPTADRTNKGILGMGYSSQFDVERHVDRVSELLEKDVDFDGWLQDVRMVETRED